jgi:hypothetical protein
MNCCRETTKMGVPRAAQALAPRAGQPQGVGSEAYLNGTSQGPTPEDAGKDGHIRGRSKLFMKYPGQVRRSTWNLECGVGAE